MPATKKEFRLILSGDPSMEERYAHSIVGGWMAATYNNPDEGIGALVYMVQRGLEAYKAEALGGKPEDVLGEKDAVPDAGASA